MSSLGKIIDNSFDPILESSKENTYKFFENYYDNITLTKTNATEDDYAIYMTKIHSLLQKDIRYIIVIVLGDKHAVGTKKQLSELNWVSLQSRVLQSLNHNIPLETHTYQLKKNTPFNEHIFAIERGDHYVHYKCKAMPIVITLLNLPNQSTEYSDKGSIVAALETFSTLVTFSNEVNK